MRLIAAIAIAGFIAGCTETMTDEEVRIAAVSCVSSGGFAEVLTTGKYDGGPAYAVKCYSPGGVTVAKSNQRKQYDRKKDCEDSGRAFVEIGDGAFECTVKQVASRKAGWSH